jgi:hypothetical protein
MRYLTIKKFSSESGYSEAAIRSKISAGVWPMGEVWRRAPDGRVLVDVLGYEAWVELSPAPPLALHVIHSPPKAAHLKGRSPAPLV